MTDVSARTCTAFLGMRQLASGSLITVALAVRAVQAAGAGEPILTFDDGSGAVIDFDLRGSEADLRARLAIQEQAGRLAAGVRTGGRAESPARTPGRPKLGVVAREVTLLPRQWEWLASQPGGASQALRRLVDEARRSDGGKMEMRAAREAAYRFLAALAGDLPGFEEVTRSLFSGDTDGFYSRMSAWPPDVRNHALKLAVKATKPAEGG